MKFLARLLATGLVISVIIAAFPACTLGQPSYIEGTVTILPKPEEGESPPIAFSACQVMIYETQTGKLSQVVSLDDSGFYRAEVRPGNYVVDLYRMGSIGRAEGMPVVVEAKSGTTMLLDITLDTGRR